MNERNPRACVSLPHSEPVHFLAGHGHGARCAECGSIIDRYDLEYEIEWVNPARILRMHARCYEIWHAEPAPATPPSLS